MGKKKSSGKSQAIKAMLIAQAAQAMNASNNAAATQNTSTIAQAQTQQTGLVTQAQTAQTNAIVGGQVAQTGYVTQAQTQQTGYITQAQVQSNADTQSGKTDRVYAREDGQTSRVDITEGNATDRLDILANRDISLQGDRAEMHQLETERQLALLEAREAAKDAEFQREIDKQQALLDLEQQRQEYAQELKQAEQEQRQAAQPMLDEQDSFGAFMDIVSGGDQQRKARMLSGPNSMIRAARQQAEANGQWRSKQFSGFGDFGGVSEATSLVNGSLGQQYQYRGVPTVGVRRSAVIPGKRNMIGSQSPTNGFISLKTKPTARLPRNPRKATLGSYTTSVQCIGGCMVRASIPMPVLQGNLIRLPRSKCGTVKIVQPKFKLPPLHAAGPISPIFRAPVVKCDSDIAGALIHRCTGNKRGPKIRIPQVPSYMIVKGSRRANPLLF